MTMYMMILIMNILLTYMKNPSYELQVLGLNNVITNCDQIVNNY